MAQKTVGMFGGRGFSRMPKSPRNPAEASTSNCVIFSGFGYNVQTASDVITVVRCGL